jgi:hypothetical protein
MAARRLGAALLTGASASVKGYLNTSAFAMVPTPLRKPIGRSQISRAVSGPRRVGLRSWVEKFSAARRWHGTTDSEL